MQRPQDGHFQETVYIASLKFSEQERGTQGEGGGGGKSRKHCTLKTKGEKLGFPKSNGQPLVPCHGSGASIQTHVAIPASSVGSIMSLHVDPLPQLLDTFRGQWCGNIRL